MKDSRWSELLSSHVLQTNGDTNTNCVDMTKDVVIPPQYVYFFLPLPLSFLVPDFSLLFIT